VAVGVAATLLAAEVGTASSHREAPLTALDPQADNTDTYAFVSPDSPDTTTLIANWIPFEEPAGGPNFYLFGDDAHYNINIDNDGDAKPDITYRWRFETADNRGTDTFLYNNGPVTSLDDENLLVTQTYTLEKITGNKVETLLEGAPVAPSHVGDASMPDYAALRAEAVTGVEGGGLSFAGQADDSFFLDLRVFDLLYGGDLSEVGADTLSGYNVNSVALQVPSAELTEGDDPVVGVWSTTERPTMRVQNADGSQRYRGNYVQMSRLGMPLVNELVIPAGLKDAFNALPPAKDATVPEVVDRVNDPEVPQLIEAIYGIPAPEAPREDIFAIFLTGIDGLNKPEGKVTPAEMLRLNTSIPPASEPNRLGVLGGDTAGFPNGRRLADDVVDIEIQALEGAVRTGELVEALAAGDAVDENDLPFQETFPYLALPHSGSGDGAPTDGVSAGGGGTAASTAPDRRDAAAAPSSDALFGVVLAGLGDRARPSAGALFCLAAVLIGWAGIALAHTDPAPVATESAMAAPVAGPPSPDRQGGQGVGRAYEDRVGNASAPIQRPLPHSSPPEPTNIRIPEMGVDQGLVELAVIGSSLQVPDDYSDIGWWSGGPGTRRGGRGRRRRSRRLPDRTGGVLRAVRPRARGPGPGPPRGRLPPGVRGSPYRCLRPGRLPRRAGLPQRRPPQRAPAHLRWQLRRRDGPLLRQRGGLHRVGRAAARGGLHEDVGLRNRRRHAGAGRSVTRLGGPRAAVLVVVLAVAMFGVGVLVIRGGPVQPATSTGQAPGARVPETAGEADLARAITALQDQLRRGSPRPRLVGGARDDLRAAGGGLRRSGLLRRGAGSTAHIAAARARPQRRRADRPRGPGSGPARLRRRSGAREAGATDQPLQRSEPRHPQ